MNWSLVTVKQEDNHRNRYDHQPKRSKYDLYLCSDRSKDSTVRAQVETLRRYGALDYTIVVSAGASQPAPLLYIAPYAGAAMGEEFMYNGKHVLIVLMIYQNKPLLIGNFPYYFVVRQVVKLTQGRFLLAFSLIGTGCKIK